MNTENAEQPGRGLEPSDNFNERPTGSVTQQNTPVTDDQPPTPLPHGGSPAPIPARQHVDAFYNVIPDTGSAPLPSTPGRDSITISDLRERYVTIIEQVVCSPNTQFDPRLIFEMDLALSTYRDAGVDWNRIHTSATGLDPTVPPVGAQPYWTPTGEPLSLLAFLNGRTRFDIANHREVKRLTLELLAQDPDPQISLSAQNNPALTRNQQTPQGLPTPAIPTGPLWRDAPMPGPTSTSRAPLPRYLTTVFFSFASATATLIMVAILITIGITNGYHVTVVDQKAQPVSDVQEFTGLYNLVLTDTPICGIGEDYLTCLEQHVVMYDVLCDESHLTASAKTMCTRLSDFIAAARIFAQKCVPGSCVTADDGGGVWGMNHLQVLPQTRPVPEEKAIPRITHDEYCYFNLGPIELGECA